MLVVVYTMELGYPPVESSPVRVIPHRSVVEPEPLPLQSFAPFKQLAEFKRLAKSLFSYIVLKKKLEIIVNFFYLKAANHAKNSYKINMINEILLFSG